MPFWAVSKLSKSKSMWLEGVSLSKLNVCVFDNSSSDSSLNARGIFPPVSWVGVLSVSVKVISMPSSAASSRPNPASFSKTGSSVRRARLDCARRKSNSRIIRAAPPPASSMVYEPSNSSLNSPSVVSPSADACSTGSAATSLAGSAIGSDTA